MDLTVQSSVATVKAEAPAQWIRGIVPVDAHTVGSGTAVIYVGCIPQKNKNIFTVSYASQSYLSHIKVTFQLPFSHLSLDRVKNMHPVFNVTFQNNFGNFNIQVGFLWKKIL